MVAKERWEIVDKHTLTRANAIFADMQTMEWIIKALDSESFKISIPTGYPNRFETMDSEDMPDFFRDKLKNLARKELESYKRELEQL